MVCFIFFTALQYSTICDIVSLSNHLFVGIWAVFIFAERKRLSSTDDGNVHWSRLVWMTIWTFLKNQEVICHIIRNFTPVTAHQEPNNTMQKRDKSSFMFIYYIHIYNLCSFQLSIQQSINGNSPKNQNSYNTHFFFNSYVPFMLYPYQSNFLEYLYKLTGYDMSPHYPFTLSTSSA